jgi:mannose-6-phosphate isomerase-like protein (cupin superfamily)
MPSDQIFKLEEVPRAAKTSAAVYREIIRRPSLSAGVYVIPPNASDSQSPHNEDEVYVVLRGRARFRCGDSTSMVEPGDLLFVKAREPHKFEEVTDELVLAVFFAPPEGSVPR